MTTSATPASSFATNSPPVGSPGFHDLRMGAALQCDNCLTEFPSALLNAPPAPCPGCGFVTKVDVFPALFRPSRPGHGAEATLVDGEASCFYHPEKKAATPCAACGRFLCALCDCELRGDHFCPACLETGQRKGKIKNIQNQRTLYDSMALSVAILPLLIFYLTFITAPIVLYLVVRHWKSPRSLVQTGNARFLLAAIIAALQLLGWVALVVSLIVS